ncbi:MAG: IS200/IS605 family transposase [Pyrinomonadaceae bacterium]|nr:IS200/IS605 family transposase [Pyrinomonadaceae bacterium]MBP6214348.1 IS200/IS605 family transposase [Pyrinomonadaceae bacterium]
MSYAQLYFHIVFGTKDHLPLIAHSWEDEMYRYLGGIIRGHKSEPIEINGMPEHVHMLTRLSPVIAISDLMREVKANSSKWARLTHEPKFRWQRRFGVFSVSESNVDRVREYIQRQKLHHQKQTYEDEYRQLLRLHQIDFDDRYLWD